MQYADISSANIISIHAPARGATLYKLNKKYDGKFQSTLPRGERPKPEKMNFITLLFQSTLPRGERRTKNGNKFKITIISIHAPARGATDDDDDQDDDDYISIHAPARGATCRLLSSDRANTISIHAPARGATGTAAVTASASLEFQSTLPRGERQYVYGNIVNKSMISIHAPARGATLTM